MNTWQPDTLGEGFESFVLDLGSDDEGPLVATLVRHLPTPRSWWHRLIGKQRPLEGADVLYVHGWSDYFFQRRLAKFWVDQGANFYALDLRKYGRSLLPGQTPGYIDNLDDYDEEIGRALRIMRPGMPFAAPDQERLSETENALTAAGSPVAVEQAARTPLMLVGHSTGGLVLSLWASRHPGIADALVLNSPWLEFQLTAAGRRMLAPLIDLRARFHAKEASTQLDFGYYARAQQMVEDREDPNNVNPEWRPERAFSVSAGWLRAILQGHSRVSVGLNIQVPVCVLLSAHSALPVRWSDQLTETDTVLDVEEVARASLKLGSSVTIERVDGAIHDVFLSRRQARQEAYGRLDRWVRGWIANLNQR